MSKSEIAPKSEHLEPEHDDNNDVEYILNDIGGSYGKFQLYNYALFSIPICVSGLVAMTYVFTALNLEYRCNIPECDNVDRPEYHTDWIENVIPFSNSKPAKCHRYEKPFQNADVNARDFYRTDQYKDANNLQFCRKDSYNQSSIVRCDHEGLVYKSNELSIVNAFGLTCKENEWKLAMVGVYSNIARLLSLMVMGILSDRFGRKNILITALCLSSILGLLQSFSINYATFMICEILIACVACVVYPAAFILAIEWAETEQRVNVSSLVTMTYSFGTALCGILAAYARDFRVFLRMAYVPGLITAALMLFGSESLRWLLVKGKKGRTEKTLKIAAKVNNTELSTKTMEIVNRRCENAKNLKETSDENTTLRRENSLRKLLTEKSLLIRFAISSFCWITGTFVSYGVSIISVSLHGDKYMNFIILALGSTPSSLITILLLKYFGRTTSISLCFLISGISIVGAKLLPVEYNIVALFLFLFAKCFSSVAFAVVYIHTTELWPTPLRHTMMGLSSTIGRVGSILAPMTPLLTNIAEMLPFISFGIVSITAAALVLLLPETLHQNLPDTIDDAKNMGKKTKGAHKA